VSQFVVTCSGWFLARGFFYPEDGGDSFLRNGATSQKTALFGAVNILEIIKLNLIIVVE
jgi:hypothetical protein